MERSQGAPEGSSNEELIYVLLQGETEPRYLTRSEFEDHVRPRPDYARLVGGRIIEVKHALKIEGEIGYPCVDPPGGNVDTDLSAAREALDILDKIIVDPGALPNQNTIVGFEHET